MLKHVQHDTKENDQVIVWYGKTDLKSAFRLLCLHQSNYWILVMMARHPETGEVFYFIDKCLPFGHLMSCALFQRFSDSLAHITRHLISQKLDVDSDQALTNYLDDFLFTALCKALCDEQLNVFLDLCNMIGVLVSSEKTEWSSDIIVFLGILLDGRRKILAIPEEKRLKALQLLSTIGNKRKATVRELQGLASLLNFLNRAIIPGRAFTRRMYAKFSGFISTKATVMRTNESIRILKQHHHMSLDAEFRSDCEMWKQFLSGCAHGVHRPFIDLSEVLDAEVLDFYTDAVKGEFLGLGAVFGEHWLFARWEPNYIKHFDPSIEYLELLGICMAYFAWCDELRNRRIILFCDNQSVVTMVNNTSSKCKNCMILIRKLTLKCLQNNARVFCHWVKGSLNQRADFLSRQKICQFKKLVTGAKIDPEPTKLPEELWPASKIWLQ